MNPPQRCSSRGGAVQRNYHGAGGGLSQTKYFRGHPCCDRAGCRFSSYRVTDRNGTMMSYKNSHTHNHVP
eukprot:5129922-Amphidinium_carterae.1